MPNTNTPKQIPQFSAQFTAKPLPLANPVPLTSHSIIETLWDKAEGNLT